MPDVKPNESREDFVKRCIPIVLDEGTAKNPSQATAICNSMYDNRNKEDNKQLEFKNLSFNIQETKEDEKYFIIKGYAAAVNNIDLGDDKIVPGAFKSTMEYFNSGKKIKYLWQHDHKQPIGVIKEIKEDSNGLFTHSILPKNDTFVKGRVIPQIEVGSIDSMSIGYNIIEKEYDSNNTRLLKDILIKEVSLVSFPMNEQAVITGYKSLDLNNLKELSERDIEHLFLSGFKASRSVSKFLVKLIKEHNQRDVENDQRDAETIKTLEKLEIDILHKKLSDLINKLK